MIKASKISISFIFILLAADLFVSCNSNVHEKNIKILTTDNFSKEVASGVVLVDFWATWCRPCKAMAPIIEEIAGQTLGKVKVGKVDIDKQGQLANQFGIQAIPTQLIFKDGQLVGRVMGLQSKDSILNVLSIHTNLK